MLTFLNALSSQNNWSSQLLTCNANVSPELQGCDETLSPSQCVVPGTWLAGLNQGRMVPLDMLALPRAVAFLQCLQPQWCSHASTNPNLFYSLKTGWWCIWHALRVKVKANISVLDFTSPTVKWLRVTWLAEHQQLKQTRSHSLLSPPCLYHVGFLLRAAFWHRAGISSIVPVGMVGNGIMDLSSMLSFVLVPKCSSELIASRGRGTIWDPRQRYKLWRGAIPRGNVLAPQRGAFLMGLRNWLTKQGQEGRSGAVVLDSIKAKLAELVMDNLWCNPHRNGAPPFCETECPLGNIFTLLVHADSRKFFQEGLSLIKWECVT